MIKIIKESIVKEDIDNDTLCGYDISHPNLFTVEQFNEFMDKVINAKEKEV